MVYDTAKWALGYLAWVNMRTYVLDAVGGRLTEKLDTLTCMRSHKLTVPWKEHVP